jgi:lysine decarboxylase
MDDPAWIASHGDRIGGCDLVKTTVGLSRYDLSGYDVARALVGRGIVIEKAGLHTITLITTFQLGPDAVTETVQALHDILAGHCLPGDAREPMPANPFSAIDDRLREAIGKVAAEEVEVYPPGIPVILEGFRVSADAVEYLVEARDKGGSIVARDTSLATLRVL